MSNSGSQFPNVRATALLLLMGGLFSLTSTGCGSCIPEGPLEKAVRVIDNGIQDIQVNTSAWQTILQRVSNDLPSEIESVFRVEAQRLVTRSIATAGIEFRCNTDFLAARAVQSLQRLKAQLLKDDPPTLPPAFCQVEPSSVDLKLSPSSWSTLMLAGYDLDTLDSSGGMLQVHLLNADGVTTPMPENRIGRTTHYLITLNLGDIASQLYRDRIAKIVVSWNGSSTGYPQVVVIPWEPKRETVVIMIGSTGPYYPARVGSGDADFDTHDDEPTALDLQGEILLSEQAISSRMYMHARESVPDHTEVEGWSPWARHYDAPAGWRIVDVQPRAASEHHAQVTEHGALTYTRPSGEVVNRFEAFVDRDGDEAGTWTSVITHWNPLQITIEEIAPQWLR